MVRFWQNIDPTDCFLLSETIKISQILFWCKICQEQEHYIEPLRDKFNLSKTNFYRLWSCPWGGGGGVGGMGGGVCVATKTIWDIITSQQTWHGSKAKTFLRSFGQFHQT